MADWDTSRYLALFVSEANEHLEAFGAQLVRVEQQGPSPEAMDELFRHAHSVKGMAASLGFDAIASLAHRLEDLLDALRTQPGRLAAVADLLLQATDTLGAQVRAAAEGAPPPQATALTLALADAVGGAAQPTPVPAPPPPAAAPPDTDDDSSLPPRFALTLRVSPASSQPGVRGFLATRRLDTLGNVFNLTPPLEDIKAGRLEGGLITLELETSEGEVAVRRTVGAVADVELESLRPVPSRPAPKPEPEAEAPRVVGLEPGRTVRVRTDLLDGLLDAAGELLLATARVRELHRGLPDALRPPLDEAADRLHGLVRSLHDRVMQARMTPISVITDRLPRAARDIARRRGREVELTIVGADTELDRAIVDELNDAVLHVLRNAIDHGIEPPEERRMRGKPARGAVRLEVRRQRDRVVIEVRDDGRGIDVDRLRVLAVERGLHTPDEARALSEREALLLCALPGLSTAAAVTDISGRGVGMDAVKRVVEGVGGSLDLESTRGQGSCIRLSLPLTVAMVNLLLVGVGDDVYGLPIAKVSGVVERPRVDLASSRNVPMLHFGESLVPVRELAAVLEVPPAADVPGAASLVVVEADDGPLALGVERLVGQEEVVLKALTRPLDLVPGLAGVTLLGNGRPVFILDVARLGQPGTQA